MAEETKVDSSKGDLGQIEKNKAAVIRIAKSAYDTVKLLLGEPIPREAETLKEAHTIVDQWPKEYNTLEYTQQSLTSIQNVSDSLQRMLAAKRELGQAWGAHGEYLEAVRALREAADVVKPSAIDNGLFMTDLESLS